MVLASFLFKRTKSFIVTLLDFGTLGCKRGIVFWNVFRGTHSVAACMSF
jgi:hypothetical protein